MNRRWCIFAFLLLIALSQLRAQPDPAEAQAAPFRTTSPVLRDRPEGLIQLDVMVADGAGNPVPGLVASDFRLFENGREQKILSVQGFTGKGAGIEPPVKVIFLIDSLDLAPDLVSSERNAVTYYLRKNGGKLDRPTSVFLLSETGLWAAAKSSSDGDALAREIEHNELALVRRNGAGRRVQANAQFSGRPGVPGPSGLADNTLTHSLEALGQIATNERRQFGRKLLIWVGPGSGIGSGTNGDLKTDSRLLGPIRWFSTLLREAHLALYSFSVGESESDPRALLYQDYLGGATSHSASIMNLHRKVLAVQSGGRVIEPGLDIVNEIENCVRESGWFYRISFDPFAAEHADEYHELKVEIDRTGVSARTSTGFYDQPYYSTDQIPPLRHVSLEELQKILELDESDAEKAHQLTGLELTARLSEPRLASLYAVAHGKRTRQQLRILADASSFLAPPPDEILAVPPPAPDEQMHLISMITSYLSSAIHKLPDFFARRITTRYQESAAFDEGGLKYQPLHQTDTSTTTVRYRQGREESDAKSRLLRPGSPELITYGVFGPALQDVFDSTTKNAYWTWIRWEKGTAGSVAVFRATLPADESLREVWVCCLPDGDGKQAYARYAGYRIEVAVDPASGAVLRLAFQFDLKSTTPLTRSDILIEYEPVDIGGKTYYCPFRSVSIVRSRSIGVLSNWDESFRTYGPYATMLNDVTFDRYHKFGSESRILTGFTPNDN